MTSDNNARKSTLTEGLQAEVDWDNLVVWDEELYDPLFQGDANHTAVPAYDVDVSSSLQTSASRIFDQLYSTSFATSIGEGPLSDYDIYAPPSSSLGLGQSWLSVSPSYTTTATSPLANQSGPTCLASFEACEDALHSMRMSTASPFLDIQSFGPSSSPQPAAASAIFNPYLTTSPHAFSGLDVSASQAFSNVGTWAPSSIQSQTFQEELYSSQGIQSIPEVEHEGAVPIPIPPGFLRGLTNTFSSQSRTLSSSQEQQSYLQQTHPDAIAIPQSQTGRLPPLLSTSPEIRRLAHSVPLSRSTAKTESRRNRSRLATPSPTSNEFGWVSYQASAQTHRLVPSSDGSRGRRSRGRIGALTVEQRNHAALMRRVGTCSNCRRRKERCDPGIPCRSCLEHFKSDLIKQPCRDIRISTLSGAFLTERLGWHPTDKEISSFIGHNDYRISSEVTYHIPLNFGFGPALRLPVHAIEIGNTLLCHEHIIYSWPPSVATSAQKHSNAVLPAALTSEASLNLQETLDTHLALLVREHFHSFPLYCSQLRILKDVYIFAGSLPPNTAYSRLLYQALKLLVLVHIGGDITLPSPSTDPALEQLTNATMSLSEPTIPTPCFIRSQFGSIMPSLALGLMKEVLSSLEEILLNRETHEWPVALATFIVVLITIESIQYHAAKLPYHHSYDSGASHISQAHDIKADDEGVRTLLAFYSACFSGCHERLHPDWEGKAASSLNPNGPGLSCEDRFVKSIRDAVRIASPGYLERRGEAERVGDDMAYFFDRLAARLLVLKT